MKRLILISLAVLVFNSISGFCQGRASSGSSMFELNSRPGFINITELNGGLGLYMVDRDFSKRLFNITTIGGIGVARNFTIGAGIGVSFYNGGTLEPVFADFRYFFKIKKTRLFAFVDGGYLLNSGTTETGRKYIVSPGAGALIPVSDHIAVSLGAALFTQLMSGLDHDSFINLKAGITCFFNKSRK